MELQQNFVVYSIVNSQLDNILRNERQNSPSRDLSAKYSAKKRRIHLLLLTSITEENGARSRRGEFDFNFVHGRSGSDWSPSLNESRIQFIHPRFVEYDKQCILCRVTKCSSATLESVNGCGWKTISTFGKSTP